MELNFNNTAFLPIDIQKGIVGAGELAPYNSNEILKVNQQLVDWFIEHNALISLINVKVDLFKFLGPNQDDTRLHNTNVPEAFSEVMLDVNDYKNVINITKYTPGAFFNTNLDSMLRAHKVDTIVLSGLVTSFGVYTTAIEAFQRGYKVIVVSDACSDRDAFIHEQVLEKLFSKIAVVMTKSELTNLK